MFTLKVKKALCTNILSLTIAYSLQLLCDHGLWVANCDGDGAKYDGLTVISRIDIRYVSTGHNYHCCAHSHGDGSGDRDDPGEPLILTPYIENNQILKGESYEVSYTS